MKLGDRVVCTSDTSLIPLGTRGVIRDFYSADYIGISWYDFRGGNSLNGNLNPGDRSGFYVRISSVKLIDKDLDYYENIIL